MKKFVINTRGCGLYLTDAHVAWLHANGHPEADHFFCEDDRSNPDLIACIEAIHASKSHLVEKAISLIRVEEALSVAAENAKHDLSAAIDAFVEFVRTLGCRSNTNSIILALRRPAFENMTWDKAAHWLNGRFGVDVDSAKDAYEHYLACYNSPAIIALGDTSRELAEYCEANGLRRYFNTITVDDGFEVKTYDETKFNVSLRKNYADDYCDSDYEIMELKPFLTRETIAAYVNAGDADGLFEYLKGIAIGGSIEFVG